MRANTSATRPERERPGTRAAPLSPWEETHMIRHRSRRDAGGRAPLAPPIPTAAVRALGAALVLASALAAAPPAAAAVLVPGGPGDPIFPAPCTPGSCTLRGAVLAANASPGGDVLLLGPGTWRLELGGRGDDAALAGDLDVHGDLAVIGAGADRTVIDGAGLDRIFQVHGDARLTLHGLTLRGGDAGTADGGAVAGGPASAIHLSRVTVDANRTEGYGGGIWAGGTLSLHYSAVTGNYAGQSAGGIGVAGTAEVMGSTISGNDGHMLYGGGIWVDRFADLDLAQSTVAFNKTMHTGGGVWVGAGGSARVAGSIVAGNMSWGGGVDCAGAIETGGWNLVGLGHLCGDVADGVHGDQAGSGDLLDPGLGALAMNGGPTPTHAPLAGSPAVDRGDPAGLACAGADQRGEPRPAAPVLAAAGAAMCDVGAVEATGRCVATPDALCMGGGRFRVRAAWDAGGGETAAQAVPLTADTGYFWFFRDTNVEVVAKVLDACTGFDRWWVFASGLTNVGVTLTVEDLVAGSSKTYRHDPGAAFQPLQDTDAFPCS